MTEEEEPEEPAPALEASSADPDPHQPAHAAQGVSSPTDLFGQVNDDWLTGGDAGASASSAQDAWPQAGTEATDSNAHGYYDGQQQEYAGYDQNYAGQGYDETQANGYDQGQSNGQDHIYDYNGDAGAQGYNDQTTYGYDQQSYSQYDGQGYQQQQDPYAAANGEGGYADVDRVDQYGQYSSQQSGYDPGTAHEQQYSGYEQQPSASAEQWDNGYGVQQDASQGQGYDYYSDQGSQYQYQQQFDGQSADPQAQQYDYNGQAQGQYNGYDSYQTDSAYNADQQWPTDTQDQSSGYTQAPYDPYAPQTNPAGQISSYDAQATTNDHYSSYQGESSSQQYSAAGDDGLYSSSGGYDASSFPASGGIAQDPSLRAASPYDPPSVNQPVIQSYHAIAQAPPASSTPPPPRGPPRGPPRKQTSQLSAQEPVATSTANPAEVSTDLPEQPAPWDPADGDQTIVHHAAPAEDDGFPEEAEVDNSAPAASAASILDFGKELPPSTPRLTVTNEDEQESSPKFPEAPKSDGEDEDLDEATRDFQALGLGQPPKKQDRLDGDVSDLPRLSSPGLVASDDLQPAVDDEADDVTTPTAASGDVLPVEFAQQGEYDEAIATGSAGEEAIQSYGPAEDDGARDYPTYDPYAAPAVSEGYEPYMPSAGESTDAASTTYQPLDDVDQTVQEATSSYQPYQSNSDPAAYEGQSYGQLDDAQNDPYAPRDAGQSAYDAYAPQSQTSTAAGQGSGTEGTYGDDAYGQTDGWQQPQAINADPYGPPAGDEQSKDLQSAYPRSESSAYGPRSDSGIPEQASYRQASPYDPGYGAYDAQQAYTQGAPHEEPESYFGGPQVSSSDDSSAYAPMTPSALDEQTRQSMYAASGQAPDPVEERRNARIPLVSFGIDGKLAVFVPGSTGGGVASSADQDTYGGYAGSSAGNGHGSKTIAFHQLSNLIPPTSFASSFDPLLFASPAFEHAGAPSSAIVRAAGAGAASTGASKTKKTAYIKYLNDAAEQMTTGLSYRKRAISVDGADDETATAAAKAVHRAEDRILLIRVLVALLEQDGSIGSPAFIERVRSLLTGESDIGNTSLVTPGFAADQPTQTSSAGVLRSYDVQDGSLQQIRQLLIRGQRKEAVDFASEQKMWAHAMIIASAVDQDTWRAVANEFIDYELSHNQASGNGSSSLKTIYHLFSGQDAGTIHGMFRPRQSLGPEGSSATSSSSSSLSTSSWKESAAIVLANRCAGDSAALTAMGDGLLLADCVEAAHICYLLSPQTAPFGGLDASNNVRMALLGAHSPLASSEYTRDLDHFILSEVYEFASSLVPVVKGQEAFPGFAHLQAYRLAHAYRLAELGEPKRAQRYCEAIASVIKATKQPSPYCHATLLGQLKALSDRLMGAPQVDSGGNWVTRKMQRPTLDGVMSAFEGRLTKFIAGEDSSDGDTSTTSKSKGVNASTSVGAFSHYSAITPDAHSGGISRVQSFADISSPSGAGGASRPASRAASALAFSPLQAQQQGPYGRSSGTTTPLGQQDPYADHSRQASYGSSLAAVRRSPLGMGAGAAGDEYHKASSTASSDAGYGSGIQSYAAMDSAPWPGQSGPGSELPKAASDNESLQPQLPSWGYEAGSAGTDDQGPKPMFFSNVQGDLPTAEADGFASPMDLLVPSGTSSPYQGSTAQPTPRGPEPQSWIEEEDDDLGLGNSRGKPQRAAEASDSPSEGSSRDDNPAAAAFRKAQEEEERQRKEAEAKKPELKPTSSWLGRIWGGGGGAAKKEAAEQQGPKAVQAHMGEQSAFYYDKDLKRWVNKKSGDSGSAAATPPPPPSRATSASPSMAARSVSGPPPPMVRSNTSDNAPPRAASSAYNPSRFSTATPPIAEGEPYSPTGTSPSPSVSSMGSPPGGRAPPLPRARSNLGDPNQPPAAQPPLRPTSAMSNAGGPPGMSTPPPPMGGRPSGAGGKKKPISSRYVRVD